MLQLHLGVQHTVNGETTPVDSGDAIYQLSCVQA